MKKNIISFLKTLFAFILLYPLINAITFYEITHKTEIICDDHSGIIIDPNIWIDANVIYMLIFWSLFIIPIFMILCDKLKVKEYDLNSLCTGCVTLCIIILGIIPLAIMVGIGFSDYIKCSSELYWYKVVIYYRLVEIFIPVVIMLIMTIVYFNNKKINQN